MTNQLFRGVLDGRIPLARKRIRPGIYWVPNLADPTAPTLQDLDEGIALSPFVEATGLAFDDLAETMRRMGEACKCCMPAYAKSTPTPPWAGNIATQKRRRKL